MSFSVFVFNFLIKLSLQNMRTCAIKGCTGLIVPSSTCSRCVKCVMADWRARKKKGLLLPGGFQPSPVSILRTNASEKIKEKKVSWADQPTQGNLPSPSSSDKWMSRVKRVRLKLPEPPPALSPMDNSSSSKNLSKGRRVHPKLSNQEEAPSPAPCDKPREMPNVTYRSRAIPCGPSVNSLPGDSGLSDLSDLTDTSFEDSDPQSDGSASESDNTKGSSGSESEVSTIAPLLMFSLILSPHSHE